MASIISGVIKVGAGFFQFGAMVKDAFAEDGVPIDESNLAKFNEIFGITHCPLVYKDIKPKGNLKLTFTKKPEYIKNFQIYFNQNPEQKYLILVTAGRNGLATDLMKYLTKSPQVTDIVYIACGRESLRKNIDENEDMIIKRVILMDEFPNTNSNNSIVHFQKSNSP